MTIFPSLLLVITSLFCSQDYWKADKYTEQNQLQHQWAENFFFSRYEFKGDEKILDLGCGDGSLTKRISNSTKGKIWGMDNSPSMIRFAKTYYGSHRLQFWLSSAEDPNVYEKLRNTVDLVVSFHCLHWVKDHDMVLGGIHSILTPGGKAFLRFCSDGFDPIQTIADEMRESEKWSGDFEAFVDPMQRFGVDKYRKKLKEHHFNIIDIHEYVGADLLKNKDELETHIKGWLPHYKFLSKGKRDLFVHELIEKYLSRFSPNEDGRIELPDCYLEVEIQRPD